MARRRMIDPNIWQSEDVAELSMFARLLLIGLISNADDEGRGKANPIFLKSTIFPYDEISIEEVKSALGELSRNISVVIYKNNNKDYYEFQNWNKWQSINRPQPSQIPPPSIEEMPENGDNLPFTEQSLINHGTFSEQSVNNHGTFTEQSVLKEEKRKEEEIEKEKEKKVTCEHVQDMFNDTCVSFPKLTVISENRKKAIKARLNKYSLDQMQEMFTKAEASDFLKGANSRNWQANFDWLMKDGNFAKVLDGNYDNKASPPNFPPKAGGKTRLENEHNYDVKMLERALFGDDG